MDRSIEFYRSIVGYDEVLLETNGREPSLDPLFEGELRQRQALLRQSRPLGSAFAMPDGGTVRLVQVLCENPARIFGLYPKKGTIAVGSDADLVVFDPTRKFTIRAENQHTNAAYTLYEGHTVLGRPEMSFQRGQRVLRQGEIAAEPGQGQFLPTLEAQAEPIT